MERDNADTSAKNKDSLEAMNKVKELHRAIEAIREDIHAMPGIERSKSDQLKQLQALRSVSIICGSLKKHRLLQIALLLLLTDFLSGRD